VTARRLRRLAESWKVDDRLPWVSLTARQTGWGLRWYVEVEMPGGAGGVPPVARSNVTAGALTARDALRRARLMKPETVHAHLSGSRTSS